MIASERKLLHDLRHVLFQQASALIRSLWYIDVPRDQAAALLNHSLGGNCKNEQANGVCPVVKIEEMFQKVNVLWRQK